MNKIKLNMLFCFLSAFFLLSCREKSPDIRVSGAWGRVLVDNASVYMNIQNKGSADDVLLSARCDEAENAMIHRSSVDGGVMRMEHVNELRIPAQQKVKLKPLDYHLMLTGLKKEYSPGDSFNVYLSFKKSGEKQITVEVKKP